MEFRQTEKHVVVSYSDYRRRINNRGDEQCGPADVYYLTRDVTAAAKHYGWGDVSPNQKVCVLGDTVSVFEIVHGSLVPVRVRYL